MFNGGMLDPTPTLAGIPHHPPAAVAAVQGGLLNRIS